MGKGYSKDDNLIYNVNGWQRYLYKDELRCNDSLKKSLELGESRRKDFNSFQQEIFARMYDPKIKKIKHIDKDNEWVKKLHSLAEETKEFKQLQKRCKGDEIWSGMATYSLSEKIAEGMMPRNKKNDLENIRDKIEGLKELSKRGCDVIKRLAQAKQELARAEQEEQGYKEGLDPSIIRIAIRKACKEATEKIEKVEDSLDAFASSDKPGQPINRSNKDELRQLADRITNTEKLQNIAKLAGRLKRIAADKQRKKSDKVRNEITDIEQGNDLGRLLPTEMLGLVDQEYEVLFDKKFLDRQLLQYKLEGKEKLGQGPIIICLDESASMRGDRELWAKATALALLDIASRQKRDWILIHFDSRVTRIDIAKKGKIPAHDLMEVMMHFSDGGTNFANPLNEACNLIEKDMPNADVLLITDGKYHVEYDWIVSFEKVKKSLNFNLYSVLIEIDDCYNIGSFSDKLFKIDELLEDSFHDVIYSI